MRLFDLEGPKRPPRHRNRLLFGGIKKRSLELNPFKGDKVELSSFARDIQSIRSAWGIRPLNAPLKWRPCGNPSNKGPIRWTTEAVAKKMYDSGMKG
jgi:hypothetical protein